MDAQDMDRALATVLADLDSVTVADVAANPHNAICKLIVAVALIGRRFVPGRASANEETVPGRSRSAATPERGHAAEPPTYGEYVEAVERAGHHADARSERLRRVYASSLLSDANPRQDPPRPTVRDRIEGTGPAVDRVISTTEREIWRKDRAELAAELDRSAAQCATIATLQSTLAERDREITDLRRVRGEGAVTPKEQYDVNRHTALRSSLQDVLGLPANALDSVIVSKVREMGDVLRVAHEQIEAARVKLDAALGACPVPRLLPELVARAAHLIEVLRSEHARERSAVDELRPLLAEARQEADGSLREMGEYRERWARIRPLIRALYAWSGARPGQDVDTPLVAAFDRWQSVECDAIDAIDAIDAEEAKSTPDEEPVDVPRQPDDPGVDAPRIITASEERGRIVAYLRRVPVANAVPAATYDAILDLAHEIERGAHVGAATDLTDEGPSGDAL